MALPTPAAGLVISYGYLWTDQASAGATEGRKDRPCAIVLATRDEDGDLVVYVAPLTHTEPDDPSAVAVPAAVKRRLGLDGAASWIITRELNRFVWPGYDLRPISRDKPDTFAWGYLPTELVEAVKQQVLAHQRGRQLRSVDRG